jgi:cation diffusion facilitator family transporter
MAEGSRTAVIAAFVGNVLIALLKFAAAAVTRSAAMLAEGFHSVADAGNQVLLLRGMAEARRRPSVEHPFGRGKEVYFWSFLVAVVLFVGGAVVSVLRGMNAVRQPHEVGSYPVSYVVLALAFMIESYAFRIALRQFNYERGTRRLWRAVRATKDTSVLVVLFEDTAAMSGLIIAALGLTLSLVTGNTVWDGLASVAIGLVLAAVAAVLAIETKALLVGEAASRADRAAIRTAVLSLPDVEGIGRLLTMHLGPGSILVNIEVDLANRLSGTQVEAAIDEIEAAIRDVLPEVQEIFVELESVERG